MTNKRRTTDAIEILRRVVSTDPEAGELYEEELTNLRVATQIHELRTALGLTQKELAVRVGTQQSVIARLEDADYRGHSLRMLSRVARALGARVEIRLVPGSEDKE